MCVWKLLNNVHNLGQHVAAIFITVSICRLKWHIYTITQWQIVTGITVHIQGTCSIAISSNYILISFSASEVRTVWRYRNSIIIIIIIIICMTLRGQKRDDLSAPRYYQSHWQWQLPQNAHQTRHLTKLIDRQQASVLARKEVHIWSDYHWNICV